jgi:hypothetical protein
VSNYQWGQKVLHAAESGDSGSLCYQARGKPEQIQFLLDTSLCKQRSVILGCRQRFQNAIKDWIGLEPDKPEFP